MPRRKASSSSKQWLVIVVVVVAIVGGLVGINAALQTQSQDRYVTDLQEIFNRSVMLTTSYEEAVTRWESGLLEDAEMLEITESNLEGLGALVSSLKSLQPPERFKEGHELSVASLEYELQSNEHMKRYIETGDVAEYEKSSELFQLAFDYESRAFQAFTEARDENT